MYLLLYLELRSNSVRKRVQPRKATSRRNYSNLPRRKLNYSLDDESHRIQQRKNSNLGQSRLFYSNEEPRQRRRSLLRPRRLEYLPDDSFNRQRRRSQLRPRRLEYLPEESIPVRRRNYSNLGRRKLDYSQQDDETSPEESTFGRPVAETSRWKNIFEQPDKTLVVEIGAEPNSVEEAIARRVSEYSFRNSGVCAKCKRYEEWLNDDNICYECAFDEFDSDDFYETYANPITSPTYTVPTRKRSINLSDLVSEDSEDKDANHTNLEVVKNFFDFIDGSMLSSTLKPPVRKSPEHSLGIDEILDFLESYDKPRAETPKQKSLTAATATPRQLAGDTLSSSTPKRSPKMPKSSSQRVRKQPIAFDLSMMSSSPSNYYCPFSPLRSLMSHYVDSTPVLSPLRQYDDNKALPVINLSDSDELVEYLSSSSGNLEGMHCVECFFYSFL